MSELIYISTKARGDNKASQFKIDTVRNFVLFTNPRHQSPGWKRSMYSVQEFNRLIQTGHMKAV